MLYRRYRPRTAVLSFMAALGALAGDRALFADAVVDLLAHAIFRGPDPGGPS
jgi:hypothetical protein